MSDPFVRVLLFAGARDAVGAGEISLPVPPQGCTARELLDALLAHAPALRPYQRALRLAINGEYARDDDRARPGDEIAVIPPVAGGDGRVCA